MINNFSNMVTNYFGMYLIKQRGLSNNTLMSYRDTMVQLLEFIECRYKIPVNKIDSKKFSKDVILEFLYYLEQERKLCIASRNQRLAAIHSFFRYLQKKDLSSYNLCSEILDIEFKRKPDTIINYMSIDEVRFLFTVPNSNSRKGLRELCILVTLYESGARVQELIDIRVTDVSLHPLSTILLHGKGNKDRLVPISNDVTKIIKTYLNEFPSNNESFLFKNRQGFKLTRSGVQYIIDKNIMLGKEKKTNFFKDRISNHSFRHSKSMHLLEAGVNLVYIRDFLGHSSVTTTELYARANSEIKRKAIEKHSINLNFKEKYTIEEKKQLINWLKNKI